MLAARPSSHLAEKERQERMTTKDSYRQDSVAWYLHVEQRVVHCISLVLREKHRYINELNL